MTQHELRSAIWSY